MRLQDRVMVSLHIQWQLSPCNHLPQLIVVCISNYTIPLMPMAIPLLSKEYIVFLFGICLLILCVDSMSFNPYTKVLCIDWGTCSGNYPIWESIGVQPWILLAVLFVSLPGVHLWNNALHFFRTELIRESRYMQWWGLPTMWLKGMVLLLDFQPQFYVAKLLYECHQKQAWILLV